MLETLILAAGSTDPSADPIAFFSTAGLAALLTLAALEIVLGIDNVVFIAVLSGKLPKEQQAKARSIGLLLAMLMRIVLLFGIVWVMKLEAELFSLPFFKETVTDPETNEQITRPIPISGKDLVLLGGGLFLIAKATWEIHHTVRGPDHEGPSDVKKAVASFGAIIAQIVLLDLVFSLDSVITAVGMVNNIAIMITAVVIAIIVMLIFAGPVSRFVERHPSMKVLALSFLVLIGVLLVADGLHQHLERGYVYFAMAFALSVDLLQLRLEKKKSIPHPVE